MATESGGAEGAGKSAAAAAVAEQQEILALSLKTNTEMAWLQFGLTIVGKIAGR